MSYAYTDDMGEISGFGGGYEQACRDMVIAGLSWFDEHPDADPKFSCFKDVFGICMEDNEDAEALSAAMVAAGEGCSGAMHQATVWHVLAVRRLGWDEYCKQMRERPRHER